MKKPYWKVTASFKSKPECRQQFKKCAFISTYSQAWKPQRVQHLRVSHIFRCWKEQTFYVPHTDYFTDRNVSITLIKTSDFLWILNIFLLSHNYWKLKHSTWLPDSCTAILISTKTWSYSDNCVFYDASMCQYYLSEEKTIIGSIKLVKRRCMKKEPWIVKASISKYLLLKYIFNRESTKTLYTTNKKSKTDKKILCCCLKLQQHSSFLL